jgi:hypothetical protein
MKSKDQQLLEEAYSRINNKVVNESLYDRLMSAYEEGESSVEDIVQHTAHTVRFAIQAIEDITGEAGYEGLPESKQENLHKALELLSNILQ